MWRALLGATYPVLYIALASLTTKSANPINECRIEARKAPHFKVMLLA